MLHGPHALRKCQGLGLSVRGDPCSTPRHPNFRSESRQMMFLTDFKRVVMRANPQLL